MADQWFAQGPEELAGRERLLAMSGLEFMQAMAAGALPLPPIAQAMDYHLDSVEEGCVRFRGTPRFAHCNPMGGIHGGWFGTLLDSAMACAVMTMLPRGRYYTTLEYKINITRALPPGTEIVAEGLIRHAGRSTGVADGTIRGAEDGRIYATGSTTCLVMDG